MPILFVYILKLSISLAVVYLFYHFALRKLTFYSWNRWYLLGYSFLSFFIAILDITPLFRNGLLHYTKTMQLVPIIDFYNGEIAAGESAVALGQSGWNNWSWCLLIVTTGAVVLSMRLIIQYFSFLHIRSKAQLLSEHETRIYHVEADIIPFSFGNSIFINKQLHSLDELQEIVRHEFVHVKQKHSIDILWSELLCIACWYNPFSWLLKRSIRQNLEFIADNKVLESGMNKKEYQYLLLKVIGNNHFSIASKFNFSSLKKRIAMMNKMKTARVHVIKFLFMLPLVAILLIAFRKKEPQANPGKSQPVSVAQEIAVSSLQVTYHSDTTPKAKSDRKEMDDRGIDKFEITDKKAVIHMRNGKTEEYDITDSSQRRSFETKYGRIISLDGDTDEAAPVTLAATNVEAVRLGRPVTAAPILETTSAETIVAAGPVATVSNIGTASRVSETPIKGVAVIDDGAPMIAPEDVLVTITKNTTSQQLEDFKKQMKEKGYELNFDKTIYNDAGRLTRICGTIKSGDNENRFSASDFERVVLTRLWAGNDAYFKVDIIVKKKSRVVI
jgi:hypothetical protein